MVLHAVRDGIERVRQAPAVLLGVLALTFLLALPLGLVVRGMIAEDLGASLAANTAETGVNSEWWDLFLSRASGLGKTFTPGIIGAAGVAYDVRKAEPYGVYDELDFDVPIGSVGDVYDRFLVRIEEMRQSYRIIEQVIERLPDTTGGHINPAITARIATTHRLTQCFFINPIIFSPLGHCPK